MAEENVDLLKHFRSEIQFESTLLSNRLSSFMSAQSFLVIAYSTAMSGALDRWGSVFTLAFPPALSLLGVALSLHAWPGIKAAYEVIEQWHARESDLLEGDEVLQAYRAKGSERWTEGTAASVSGSRFRKSNLFAINAPWIFGIAWCFFGGLAVVLHFFG